MEYSGICISNSPESSRAVSAVHPGRPLWIITPTRMASPNKKRASSYKLLTMGSWEEYLSLITDSPYQNWAFRGQRDASAPLFSALSRHLMTFGVVRSSWPRQEARVLRIFKRKAIHFLEHIPDPNDDFQWLALMQDHGAPTRLLDFTWSPYIASYFALQHTTHEGVIWACNPAEIGKQNSVDLEKPGSFRKYFLPGDRTTVWMGSPHEMNRRLIAQSGTFLVPGVLDRSIEDIIKTYPNPENTLVKFIMPANKMREKGM